MNCKQILNPRLSVSQEVKGIEYRSPSEASYASSSGTRPLSEQKGIGLSPREPRTEYWLSKEQRSTVRRAKEQTSKDVSGEEQGDHGYLLHEQGNGIRLAEEQGNGIRLASELSMHIGWARKA